MSAHTVGPWEYDAESGEVIAPKCGYQWSKGAPIIATVPNLDYSEGDANGCLIAAAPDLLAACKSMLETCGSSAMWQGETRKSLELIESAIKKTEAA